MTTTTQEPPAVLKTAQPAPRRAARPQRTQPPAAAEPTPVTPVSGILGISDGRAFLRRAGYQRGPDDVYVAPALIKQYGLRAGDLLEGAARPPRTGKTRDKYPGLTRVDSVNGADPALAAQRPEFAELTPLYPQDRLRLEGPARRPPGSSTWSPPSARASAG